MRAARVTPLLLAAVLATGCSSILVKPEADNVRSVAIVSVFMNRDIYDVEAPKANAANSLGSLVKAAAQTTARETLGDAQGKELQPLITYGLKSFSEQLNAGGFWKVIPPTEVVSTPAYKSFYEAGQTGPMAQLASSFAKLTLAEYVAPEGMLVITPNMLVEEGTVVRFGDAKDPHEEARQHLAKLAQELGVDAVMVVQLDTGYKRGWFTVNGVQRAGASVAATAVAVNQQGKVVLKTPLVAPGGGKRFEGDTLRMVRASDGVVLFEDPEVINSFNTAIEQAAVSLRTQVGEEYAAK